MCVVLCARMKCPLSAISFTPHAFFHLPHSAGNGLFPLQGGTCHTPGTWSPTSLLPFFPASSLKAP